LAAKWVASHNSFGIVSSSPLFVLLKRFTLVCRVPFPFPTGLTKKKKKKENKLLNYKMQQCQQQPKKKVTR
jgi:hypothetical protein